MRMILALQSCPPWLLAWSDRCGSGGDWRRSRPTLRPSTRVMRLELRRFMPEGDTFGRSALGRDAIRQPSCSGLCAMPAARRITLRWQPFASPDRCRCRGGGGSSARAGSKGSWHEHFRQARRQWLLTALRVLPAQR
jgi:hypothetical protein